MVPGCLAGSAFLDLSTTDYVSKKKERRERRLSSLLCSSCDFIVMSRMLKLVTALLFVCLECVLVVPCSARLRSPYRPRLVGGKESRNAFGDLLGYYIFAEAGAVVTPAPQWEIFLGAQRQTIFENVAPRVAAPSRRRVRPLTNKTYTTSPSLSLKSNSLTLHNRRETIMTWSTISHPFGAPPVRGTRRVAATPNNRVSMTDWVFPIPGYYNMLMNVSLFWGAQTTFNVSLYVDPQPGRIVMRQFPAGYNGSFLTTAPQAQLEDLLGNPVRVSTPVVAFTVLNGPTGYRVLGTPSAFPDRTGLVRLSQVVLTLPGRYVVSLVARLTDNTTIQTPSFSLTVQRALPTNIIIITPPSGVTRAVFFTTPRYRIVDQVGFSQDSRVNMTIKIGLNEPSVVYSGQDTVAHMQGVLSRVQAGFDFVFPDVSIDLPGNYEVVATLYMDGEVLLETKSGLVLGDLPTFSVVDLVEVNTISRLLVMGSRPPTQPLYLKMSNELACQSSASDVALWGPEASPFVSQRNVSFVPFVSGRGKYLCIGVPSQTDFIPLLLNYEPAFNEPFPLQYTFEITGVSTCKTLTNTDVFLYRLAGWTTAATGRSYGCHLSPPVSGTIAPCDCFFILTCVEFRHSSFTPPELDIGLCVCCKGWVSIIAAVSTAGFFAGILYVIYKYV